MAEDKKVVIDVEVKGTDESINSVKDLKNAIKAARDEQIKAAQTFGESSKEFIEASKKVSQLKDKVDDLADSTKSLKGSGIERASEGFNQLGEGLRNLDFDKVKVGLVAMKSALAAVGIGLIVQAVMYLVENFDSLSKGSGVLAKVLRGVGDVITNVTDYIYKFTDAIGLTNSALDKMGESVVENANAAKDALASQTAEYDRQIAIAKASGKSAVDLEIAKQQAIIDTNKALVEQTIAYVRRGGVLDEEQKKLLTGQLESIKNAKAQQEVIEITAEKTKNDKLLSAQKEHNKKLKDEEIVRYNEYIKSQEDELAALKNKLEQERVALEQQRLNEIAVEDAKSKAENDKKLANAELTALQNQADIEAQIALLEAKRQVQLDDLTITNEQRALINEQYAQQEDKLREEKIAKDKAADLQATQNSLNSAQSLTSSLQSLSDSYFYFKTKNLQKGSAEELKQAKKQFDINKGIAIASATISGIQGVVNALSAQSVIPEPFGAILKGVTAVAVGAAAVANISKIASQKFDAGGGGGGASAVSAVAVPSPPTINTPSANTNQSTSFDETGKKIGGEKEPINPTINVNSTVSVQEINEKQNGVKVLEQQSTF